MSEAWYMDDLVRADARVTLTDFADPGSTMRDALLNPSSLPISIDVAIGELNPVGASQTVLQYGYTQAASIPIELYFSTQLQGRYTTSNSEGSPGRTAIAMVDIQEYVNWLASFCYASQPGMAPSPLLIIWPHTLNIVVVVNSFRAEYIRFARDLAPTAARVMMDCKELRFSFKSSFNQRTNGWNKLDPRLSKSGTGKGLNLGK
jgi:hypothetical protein